MSFQQYIPLVELESHRVMGLLNLGANAEFDGTETSHTLPSGVVVALMKYVPQKRLAHEANPWYMAVGFSRSDIRANMHKGFPEYVPMGDVLPAETITTASGIGHQVKMYKGPMVDGIEGNFAAGRLQHDPA